MFNAETQRALRKSRGANREIHPAQTARWKRVGGEDKRGSKWNPGVVGVLDLEWWHLIGRHTAPETARVKV